MDAGLDLLLELKEVQPKSESPLMCQMGDVASCILMTGPYHVLASTGRVGMAGGWWGAQASFIQPCRCSASQPLSSFSPRLCLLQDSTKLFHLPGMMAPGTHSLGFQMAILGVIRVKWFLCAWIRSKVRALGHNISVCVFVFLRRLSY